MLASEQTARRAGPDFSQQGQALDKRHQTEWIKYSDCQTLTERRKYNNSAKVTLFKLYKPANIFSWFVPFLTLPRPQFHQIIRFQWLTDDMIWWGLRQFWKKNKKKNGVKSMYSSWLWLVTEQHNTKGTSCSFLNLKLKKHTSIQNSFVISKQNFYETIQRVDIKVKVS